MDKYNRRKITLEDISRAVRLVLEEVGKDYVTGGVTYKYHSEGRPHIPVPDFKPKKKVVTAYKAFKLRLDKQGNNLAPGFVFPLYVNTNVTDAKREGLKLGMWYKSGEGECWLNTKNNRLYTRGDGYDTDGNKIDWLSFRPGWHLCNTPYGSQRGKNKVQGGKEGTGNNYQNTRDNEVWAKVEICLDYDATQDAIRNAMEVKMNASGDAYKEGDYDAREACLQSMPDSGFYRYKTNSNASDDQTWYIVDKIRITEVLDDDRVDRINGKFFNKLSRETGRKINSDPYDYTSQSGDIPYWKMPRENGRRFSKDDISKMGYEKFERTKLKY